MRGKMRRRARVCHVCFRTRPCSSQVSARAHVEEAAMGTLRSVGMQIPSRCTRSMHGGRGPASGECACAGGGGGVAQGQCRQVRRGAAWSRSPLPFWGYFRASRAHRDWIRKIWQKMVRVPRCLSPNPDFLHDTAWSPKTSSGPPHTGHGLPVQSAGSTPRCHLSSVE